MKTGAFNRKNFTARFFDFTRTTDGEGGFVYTHFYKRDIKLAAMGDGYGRLLIYFDDEDIRPNARLDDLKDNQGKELLPGIIWVVGSVLPSISPLGTREGFTGNASPDLTDAQ